MTVNTLATEMVMDRTTMGRNVRPLQRDGLITAVMDKTDRRRKTLVLTDVGLTRPTPRRSFMRHSAQSRPRSCAVYCMPSLQATSSGPRSNSVSWPVALSLNSRRKR